MFKCRGHEGAQPPRRFFCFSELVKCVRLELRGPPFFRPFWICGFNPVRES